MLPLLLQTFVYPNKVTEVNKAEMYDQINETILIDKLYSHTFAFCIILGFYLVLVAISWWIEYRGMIGSFKPFKIVTIGIGDASKVKPVPFFIITISIYLGIIFIVSGLLPQIIVSIFDWTISMFRITDIFKL